jgi:hypothetical protein
MQTEDSTAGHRGKGEDGEEILVDSAEYAPQQAQPALEGIDPGVVLHWWSLF